MQQANIYEQIMSDREGRAPLVVNVVVRPQTIYTVGGAMQGQPKNETYVLLSALPEELKKKVELAIQAMFAAG